MLKKLKNPLQWAAYWEEPVDISWYVWNMLRLETSLRVIGCFMLLPLLWLWSNPRTTPRLWREARYHALPFYLYILMWIWNGVVDEKAPVIPYWTTLKPTSQRMVGTCRDNFLWKCLEFGTYAKVRHSSRDVKLLGLSICLVCMICIHPLRAIHDPRKILGFTTIRQRLAPRGWPK